MICTKVASEYLGKVMQGRWSVTFHAIVLGVVVALACSVVVAWRQTETVSPEKKRRHKLVSTMFSRDVLVGSMAVGALGGIIAYFHSRSQTWEACHAMMDR